MVRVERTDYPSTPMATVALRARTLRTRRRRRTVLATAAAVAVVAPSAIWFAHSPGSSSEPSGPPPHHFSAGIEALLALPAPKHWPGWPGGSRSVLDYTAGHTYVAVGGDRLQMTPNAISAVPAQGGGLVVFTLSNTSGPMFASGTVGQISVVVRGAPTKLLGCGSQGFATSADRTQSAYWLMKDCHPGAGGTLHAGPLATMGEAAQPGIPTPKGFVVSPVGFLGASVVANRFPTTGTDVSARGVWLLGAGAPRLVPGLTWASGVTEGGPSGDLVAGNLTGGGSGVVDVATGRVLWKAPASWSVDGFSSDGRLVVARSSAGDGNGLRILDSSDGSTATDVPALPGTGVFGEAWGEDGSLLILVGVGHASAIVRYSPTGVLSRYTVVAANPPNGLRYGFGTNP